MDDGRNTVLIFDKHFPEAANYQPGHYLYYTPEHLVTQTNQTIFSCFLLQCESSDVVAELHCTSADGVNWVCPPRSPFGGIQLGKRCANSDLFFFLNTIKMWIETQSGKKLTIKTAPTCYDPGIHTILHDVYNNTDNCELCTISNQHIPITPSNFLSGIHLSEKRRLKKCLNAGFEAGLTNQLTAKQCYDFLLKCRTTKGYQISVSNNELEVLLTQFPNDFLIFTATKNNEIIALVIVVRVNEKVLYTFLSSYLPDFATFSPIVFLTQKIYEYGQQNGFKILDLGTSLDHLGTHKESLSRFKRNLGAETSEKVTYHFTW
ncbi:hypothetical protein DYBT9623_02458 [Dyadobacter sp. CECT 9623]|uniref:BioF2-like acetyltransferase domain-containing protein n=1 Tax=Dyadobacter linearis TaxID=2823330 RepID=A0ABN7R6N0_9BACT|nr:hypothetical protein DYBT9623_02458 [Dyadobacter sp. CECT 9623]